MSSRTRSRLTASAVDPQTEWTRRRLQTLLGAGLVLTLVLTAGVVWTVSSLLTNDSPRDQASTGQASAEDKLAADPLPSAAPEAAQPGVDSLSSGQTGTIELPLPMEVGEAGVATGFPQTTQGALAQLAAINSAALTSASVKTAQQVIGHWSTPGGPTAQNWSGVKAVATLLESAGLSADGAGSLVVGVEPKMGFIKGSVGEDFVVPCIDFIITATPTGGQPQQVAAADCQRMVWREGRWVIGPGTEPAPAPSLWPGTQESFDAGYQWLEVPQQ